MVEQVFETIGIIGLALVGSTLLLFIMSLIVSAIGYRIDKNKDDTALMGIENEMREIKHLLKGEMHMVIHTNNEEEKKND